MAWYLQVTSTYSVPTMGTLVLNRSNIGCIICARYGIFGHMADVTERFKAEFDKVHVVLWKGSGSGRAAAHCTPSPEEEQPSSIDVLFRTRSCNCTRTMLSYHRSMPCQGREAMYLASITSMLACHFGGRESSTSAHISIADNG